MHGPWLKWFTRLLWVGVVIVSLALVLFPTAVQRGWFGDPPKKSRGRLE